MAGDRRVTYIIVKMKGMIMHLLLTPVIASGIWIGGGSAGLLLVIIIVVLVLRR